MKRLLPSFVCLVPLLLVGCADDNVPDLEIPEAEAPVENTDDPAADTTGATEEQQVMTASSYNELSAEEQRVIVHKGTELGGTGALLKNKKSGTYICRQCNAALYASASKFESGCGWPSFDDELPGAVRHEPDADGFRVEILCENCGGHLGHVFKGERMTEKNTRHCVNSVSIAFIEDGKELPQMIRLEGDE